MNLQDLIPLFRASRYAQAASPGALLPIVYGDMSTDAGLGGVCPGVSINQLTWTYLVSDSACQSIDKVYLNDIEQTAGFTVNPDVDYQSTGRRVAIVTFTVNPGGAQVSVRMKGTKEPIGGALITNPIRMLQHFFTTYGTWQTTDFDTTIYQAAVALANSQGYTAHWIFAEERTYKEWLTDVFYNVIGDHFRSADGTLLIFLDHILGASPLEELAAYVVAKRDLAGDVPEASIELVWDDDNLMNSVILRYQYRWHDTDPATQYAADLRDVDRRSVSRFGEAQRPFSFKGVRTFTHASALKALLLARYAHGPALARFTMRDLSLLPVRPADHLSLSWDWGPRDGLDNPYRNEIVKVLNIRTDLTQYTQEFECLDTGLALVLTRPLDGTHALDGTHMFGPRDLTIHALEG